MASSKAPIPIQVHASPHGIANEGRGTRAPRNHFLARAQFFGNAPLRSFDAGWGSSNMRAGAKAYRAVSAFGDRLLTPVLAILLAGVELAWLVFLGWMLLRLIR